MAEIIPVYFPSLFWRNVSPEDLYPENKETIYGKLNELLYDSIRRWELKMKQDIELKTVRLLIVSHSSKKLKQ